MTDPYDATRCPKCGDVWIIRRIQPAATGARAVDLRICSCDQPHCRNQACKKPVPHSVARCPHCGTA